MCCPVISHLFVDVLSCHSHLFVDVLAGVSGHGLQQVAEQPVGRQDVPRHQHGEEAGHGAQRGALQQRGLGQPEHRRQQHLGTADGLTVR